MFDLETDFSLDEMKENIEDEFMTHQEYADTLIDILDTLETKCGKVIANISDRKSVMDRIVNQVVASYNNRQSVTVYQHQYSGWSMEMNSGNYNIDAFPNDIIKSYDISDGCCATFYMHSIFKGRKEFTMCGPKRSGVPSGIWNYEI